MDQPYYMIDFSAAACSFEIRVNDIPVFALEIKGQISSNIPVNYAILQSGRQTISSRVLPLTGNAVLEAGAELRYNIQLFDVMDGFEFKEQISGYKSPAISPGEMIPVFTNSMSFDATVPYTTGKWTNGLNLRNINRLDEQLRHAYNQVAVTIDSGDYELFKEAIAQREARMKTSMYLTDQESDARLNALIRDFRSGFGIMPVTEDAVTVFSGYGKMASLQRPGGGSALYFYNKETQEELMLDVAFYLPEGAQQLEII